MSMSSWRIRYSLAAARVGVLLATAAAVAPAASASGATGQWVWPVKGSVITHYANDNSRPYAGGMHRGIDIAAAVGTDVVAAHAGRVTFAGPLGSSGLTVAIESADGYAASYLHLSGVAVRRGEPAAAGEKLGEVGTTGKRSAAAPHLHFGVHRTGREHSYIDPLMLLPPTASAGRDKAPLPVPARQRLPAVAPAPARQTRLTPLRRPVAPAHRRSLRPVPAGLGLRAERKLSSARMLRPATVHRRDPAPEMPSTDWGALVSVAGVLFSLGLLCRQRFTWAVVRAAAAIRRTARAGRRASTLRGRSRAGGRDQPPQPLTPAPPGEAARVVSVGAVSQMG